MARQRTQRSVGGRIDPTYFRRLSPWRRARRASVFIATAAAILLVAFTLAGNQGELIHNPGRLTFVHAVFQNNCAACHDGCDNQGHPTGKFSKSVSDTACLKCHDGAIHHENQATMVMMDNSRRPSVPRSADCASCHTEHRGQAALISANDLQCLQCHIDLNGRTLKTPPAEVPLHVSGFTLEDHPRFGRSLMVNGKLFNPTVLRFNHKRHLGILKGAQQDCIWCHDPTPAAGLSLTWEIGKNAFAIPGNSHGPPAPLDDGTSHHRSLTQVNFLKNCEVCHHLGALPGSDVAIPHADMGQVRKVILAYIADRAQPWQKFAADRPAAKEKPLNDRLISILNDAVPGALAKPDAANVADTIKAAKTNPIYGSASASDPTTKLPADLAAKLTTAAGKLPTNVLAKADRDKVLAYVSSTTQPAQRLRPLVIARLREEVAKGLSGAAKQKVLDQFDAAFARFSLDTPDPRLLEAYVAYAKHDDGGESCIKCHDMEGSAASVPPEWSLLPTQHPIAAAPSTAAATTVATFSTKPTGIPAGPRRWYVNSEFNHDAHRSMNCVECHAAALTSEKTSDVLSPNIQWEGLRFKSDGSGDMVPATRSCVECHHADNSDSPGAAANCTECHVYHDRSHENVPKPTPTDVLNGKIAPASGLVSSAAP